MIVLIGVVSLRQSSLLIAILLLKWLLFAAAYRCATRDWVGCRCTVLRLAGGGVGVAEVDVPDAGSGVEIVSCTCG